MEKSVLLTSLKKVQQELKAPKNQRNDFGKYNYRSCEDIFEAVKPLLEKNGLVLKVSDELLNVGDRFYIKATATIYEIETGESIENTSYAREEDTKKGMDGSQITGASSSYARKYALNGLFLIDDVKDSDGTNTGDNTKKPAPKPAPKALTFRDQLVKYCKTNKLDMNIIATKYNINKETSEATFKTILEEVKKDNQKG